MGWWIAGKRIEEGSVRGMDQQLISIWMIENLKIRNNLKKDVYQLDAYKPTCICKSPSLPLPCPNLVRWYYLLFVENSIKEVCI